MQSRMRRRTTPVACNSIANGSFIPGREPGSSFLRRGSTTVSPERPVHELEKQGKGEDRLKSTNMRHLQDVCVFTLSARQHAHSFYHSAFRA